MLMVAVLVAPAVTKGGSAKGVDVTYTSGGQVYKSIISQTGSGIIHQWVYEKSGAPYNMHCSFKPQSKFSEPQGPEWGEFTFQSINYTGVTPAGALDVFGADGTKYWYKCNMQG